MADSITTKQWAGCILGMIALCITAPIWYWLVYQILMRVDATPTMWVFYWIYMPVGLLLQLLRVPVDAFLSDKEKVK